MRVFLFGATGMVGQGVLRECLADPDVESVTAIVRSTTGVEHDRLREIVHRDFFDLSDVADELGEHDACFFCLGVSSGGMSEEKYAKLTYELTLGAARVLAERNPAMTFVYVSGAGTDSTEKGRSMWARVKGRTENELLRVFENAYMFRPAFIRPGPGIRSKTTSYRVLYALTRPLFPLLRAVAPRYATTTENVGRAMLKVARDGHARHVLENWDIDALCA